MNFLPIRSSRAIFLMARNREMHPFSTTSEVIFVCMVVLSSIEQCSVTIWNDTSIDGEIEYAYALLWCRLFSCVKTY